MTVQEVLEATCNKRQLNPNDHFLRFKLHGADSYRVPEKSVYMEHEVRPAGRGEPEGRRDGKREIQTSWTLRILKVLHAQIQIIGTVFRGLIGGFQPRGILWCPFVDQF